nr:hypothetical protein [Tanacetum cinerariifolium]
MEADRWNMLVKSSDIVCCSRYFGQSQEEISVSKMEADAHPLTFDDLFNSSGFDSGVTIMPVEPVTDTITKKAEKGSEMDEIKSLDVDNGVFEIRRVILEEAISAMPTKFTTQNTRREIGYFTD